MSNSSAILAHTLLCLHARYEDKGQREYEGGKSQPAAVRENSELPCRDNLLFTKPNNFLYLHAHVLMSCPSSLAFPRQEQNIIFSVRQGLLHQICFCAKPHKITPQKKKPPLINYPENTRDYTNLVFVKKLTFLALCASPV